MKLLVFGASGPTGRLIAADALAAGHRVTAFARRAATVFQKGVAVACGDALDAGAVGAAVAGHEAVICALGVRSAHESPHLLERSLGAIVPAMQAAGARRLVVLSALGVGGTRAQAPLLPCLMYRLLLGTIFRDKAAGEAIVVASSLDWTLVYPPLLTNAPAQGACRAGETLALTGFPKIARADVARFMVDTLSSTAWVRRRVLVSSV